VKQKKRKKALHKLENKNPQNTG